MCERREMFVPRLLFLPILAAMAFTFSSSARAVVGDPDDRWDSAGNGGPIDRIGPRPNSPGRDRWPNLRNGRRRLPDGCAQAFGLDLHLHHLGRCGVRLRTLVTS
jgi:hypothetical protein